MKHLIVATFTLLILACSGSPEPTIDDYGPINGGDMKEGMSAAEIQAEIEKMKVESDALQNAINQAHKEREAERAAAQEAPTEPKQVKTPVNSNEKVNSQPVSHSAKTNNSQQGVDISAENISFSFGSGGLKIKTADGTIKVDGETVNIGEDGVVIKK